jgi:signal transduction histidine kinase
VYFLRIRKTFTHTGLILLLLTEVSLNAYSQNQQRVDSLLQVAKASVNERRSDVYVELAIEFADHDNIRSLEYIDMAYTIAVSNRDSLDIVHCGRIKGQLLRRVERIDESIELFESLLPTARRFNLTEDLKTMLNSLALSYTMKADYFKALDLNFQSLILREQGGDKAEISISLNNIGFVYFKLKNYDKAVEYYLKALDYKRQVNDQYDLDRLMINLALCYNNLGQFQEAKSMIEEAVRLCDSGCLEEIQVEIYFSYGFTFFGMQNYAEAKEKFDQSYQLAERIQNNRFQIENLYYLGRIAFAERRFSDAEKLYADAQQLAIDYGYNQLLINIYHEFAALYSATNQYEKVAQFQDKYIGLKDSLIGEELVKNIASIQTQFEERQNRATIATKEEELSRQRTLNAAIGIIAFLSGLLVFVLYRNNKIIKHVNAQLADAKEVIEKQNAVLQTHADELQDEVDKATAELQTVNTSLLNANEEMDHLIYKTSHDIRGPLASLKGICNVALLDIKDPLALDYLHKLNDTAVMLNRILTRLQIVNQIKRLSILLEPLNVAEKISEIIQVKSNKGLPSNMVISQDIPENLVYHTDRSLLHIIIENLVENAIKFYNDSQQVNPQIRIQVKSVAQELILTVQDNGIGISQDDSEKIFRMFSRASERSSTGGLGLYLVKLAVSRLGGQVSAHRTDEGFTEFRVVLPLYPAPVKV